MLAKVFDYPTVKEVEYPNSVWEFLNTAPRDQNGKPLGSESRRDSAHRQMDQRPQYPGFYRPE
jgi:hypothetical protein